MKTLGQQRAADALACIDKLRNQSNEFKSLYRAYVDRLGPAIVMNGLGQALATELAAAGSKLDNDRERAHRTLYDNLQRWLCREEGGVYPSSSDDLLKAIMKEDEAIYLQAQAEALAWLEWHKKCCRASLPKSERADP